MYGNMYIIYLEFNLELKFEKLHKMCIVTIPTVQIVLNKKKPVLFPRSTSTDVTRFITQPWNIILFQEC